MKGGPLYASLLLSMIILTAGGSMLGGYAPSATETYPVGAPLSLDQCVLNGRTLLGMKVALVEPTFSAAAYGGSDPDEDGGFYQFYWQNQKDGGIVSRGLGLLTLYVPGGAEYEEGWAQSLPLYTELTGPDSRTCGLKVTVVTEQQVDGGLDLGQFDVVVTGHQEYCTPHELANFMSYVRGGGYVFAADGNACWVKVSYDQATQYLTFVQGHGWQSNGTAAWKNSSLPYEALSREWTGGSYYLYRGFVDSDGVHYTYASELYPNVGTPLVGLVNTTSPWAPDSSNVLGASIPAGFGYGYSSGEENAIRNWTGTTAIACSPVPGICAYEHQYGKGLYAYSGMSLDKMLPIRYYQWPSEFLYKALLLQKAEG